MSNTSERPDLHEWQSKYAAEAGAATAEVHPDDHIFNWLVSNPIFDAVDHAVHYYFNDGRNSALKLKALIERFPVSAADPRLLEFASGYGCVSRHIVEVMPHVSLTSCDIHPQAIDFLRRHIPGARQLQSAHSPQDFAPTEKYHYVFALSFFSHMPRSTWSAWLRRLYDTLESGGYLMFTTQGEASRPNHGNPTIPEDGFWFVAESEQVDLDASEYGQTIVTPSFVVPEVAAIRSARLVALELRGWWNHQDLYVVRKENVDE